jgi:hypothetical protein
VDKSASLVGIAAPRRSTSSLDVMWHQIQRAILPSLTVLLMVSCAHVSFAAYRIVKRLKANYPILWDELGSPIPELYWVLGFDVFMFLPFHRPHLTEWLLKGHYLKLNDAEVNQLASRLKMQVCLIPFLVGLYVLHLILRLYR